MCDGYIYAILLHHPVRGELNYIGKTINPKRRWLAHRMAARRSAKGELYQAWREASEEPTFEIVCSAPTANLNAVERRYIAHAEDLSGERNLNQARGGEGLWNPKPSTRRKMSDSQKRLWTDARRAWRSEFSSAYQASSGSVRIGDSVNGRKIVARVGKQLVARCGLCLAEARGTATSLRASKCIYCHPRPAPGRKGSLRPGDVLNGREIIGHDNRGNLIVRCNAGHVARTTKKIVATCGCGACRRYKTPEKNPPTDGSEVSPKPLT